MQLTNAIERIRDYLHGLKLSYQRTINPEDQDNREVLIDLAKFCHVSETAFDADPLTMARWNGRREVFLRIQTQRHLTDDQLWALYNNKGA